MSQLEVALLDCKPSFTFGHAWPTSTAVTRVHSKLEQKVFRKFKPLITKNTRKKKPNTYIISGFRILQGEYGQTRENISKTQPPQELGLNRSASSKDKSSSRGEELIVISLRAPGAFMCLLITNTQVKQISYHARLTLYQLCFLSERWETYTWGQWWTIVFHLIITAPEI